MHENAHREGGTHGRGSGRPRRRQGGILHSESAVRATLPMRVARGEVDLRGESAYDGSKITSQDVVAYARR
jgi:hypothetical protein